MLSAKQVGLDKGNFVMMRKNSRAEGVPHLVIVDCEESRTRTVRRQRAHIVIVEDGEPAQVEFVADAS